MILDDVNNTAFSSLEGLELEPQIITRLNIGIESIFNLAVSVPQNLFEHRGITDERSAIDLLMRAEKTLTKSGTLVKDFATAKRFTRKKTKFTQV
jgi:hypothetical protein